MQDTPQDERKAFATLQAEFALMGHQLHTATPTNGPQAYYATRWGMVRWFPGLDDAEAFLRQIGGKK
jgi:hypothetical protein